MFLIFDAVTKLVRVESVLKAAAQLGFSVTQFVGTGALLLFCTILYVIPPMPVLGAVLLTGYLGGATAIQLHAAKPILDTLFPVIFVVLAWAGIFFREERLRTLIPLRKSDRSLDIPMKTD